MDEDDIGSCESRSTACVPIPESRHRVNPETRQGEVEIRRLIVDLLADLHSTNFLWQVGALVLSLALAWWVARWVRTRIRDQSGEDRPEQGMAVKIGLRGVSRVLFPLCALIL